MKLLVTGGLGFIGSHTVVELIQNGYDVVIVDNLSNSDVSVLHKLHSITNVIVPFYQGDIADIRLLDQIMQEHRIDAVIHFAALKSVNESVREPLRYYENNVAKTITMINHLQRHGITKLIFSSSATVYSPDNPVPFVETMKQSSTHAYGNSKIIIENVLSGLHGVVDSVSLRYFNPVGAHPSGLIGESPSIEATNLMPIINEVALGKRSHLVVFGTDYPTPDGSALRDYIHVVDVAVAHVKAINFLWHHPGVHHFNIGTGRPTSVLEIIKTYSKVNNVDIPYHVGERRDGDVAVSYANGSLAEETILFTATKTLEEMCIDAYNFVTMN
jgi:UDP-glucose 4-epimerase